MNIYDLISRAQKLREETKIDSVSPERVGALCEDTLKYINEYQLLASSPALHKIYASVSAMQSDKSPKSDITGNALKPGQLVVIVPASQSDATAGNVYRYDGPSGNTSAWAFISKIGAVPADAQLNDTSANPVQNKVVTSVLTGISEDLQGVHQQLDDIEEDSDRCARDIESLRSRTTRLEIEMPNKANQSGKYPEMTAGFANNLVGRGEAVEATLNFRASGGKSIEDGAARVKELKGNSIVWNQMIRNPQFADNAVDGWGINLPYEFNGRTLIVRNLNGSLYFTQYPYFHQGHKYLYDVRVGYYGSGSTSSSLLWVSGQVAKNAGITNTMEVIQGIFHNTQESGNYAFGFATYPVLDGMELHIDCEYGLRLFDLTQMFGADNEPTSVEEFYNRIPQNVDLCAYNEGEVVSTNAEGIKSVGINAWDEEWEQGYIMTNGQNGPSASQIRSKNYIKVLPNTAYYFPYYLAEKYGSSGSLYLSVHFYDSAKNRIKTVTTYTNWGESSWIMTTPENCEYMRFDTSIGNGTYNGDICINLSHSGYRNGEYQPYMQFIRDIDKRIREAFPYGMRSAEFAHDKVYNKNGKGYIEKCIGMVDLGTLNWSYGTYLGENYFHASDSNVNEDAICGRYNRDKVHSNVVDMIDKSFIVASNQVYIKDSAYTDAASFKAAMSGVMFCYKLTTPEVIQYDEPFNLDYEVWDFGTEQMLATEPSAPIKASIVYGFNAVDSLRNAEQEIAELKTQIAQMQASMASMITQNVNVTTE